MIKRISLDKPPAPSPLTGTMLEMFIYQKSPGLFKDELDLKSDLFQSPILKI
jgi:hypothetical protein